MIISLHVPVKYKESASKLQKFAFLKRVCDAKVF